MFDLKGVGASSLDELRQLVLGLDQRVSDAERIDRIRSLEELKGAVAAAQAREADAFAVSQRVDQRARGVPVERIGKGVAAQVGLARRISPFEATRYVGQVGVLIRELPACFDRLSRGEVPEWRVLLVARDTAWLSAEHRAVVDAEVAPQLERLGKRRTIDLVKKLAYRLDPHGYLARLDQAEAERHVSLRPAADNMARLNALLPLPQAVAAYAALHSGAAAVAGVGDESRSRSQLMADLLVERVTGQSTATGVPVEVNLVMTDQSLFGVGSSPDEPATIIGGGTIPAHLARRMLTDQSGEVAVFLRRLYTHPTSGQLAAMDSHSRCFTPNQRHFLLLRDQICRAPWCDAPIRHADHITPVEDEGQTNVANGQGLCEACNYHKTAPGWGQYCDDLTGDVITTTPTGHTYPSSAPEPPATRNPQRTKRLSRWRMADRDRRVGSTRR
ncbi:MAG: HNH endonuclease [Actinomycetota bacterium]|nr:HNH endonuclease [Actinomycetota bacterium]